MTSVDVSSIRTTIGDTRGRWRTVLQHATCIGLSQICEVSPIVSRKRQTQMMVDVDEDEFLVLTDAKLNWQVGTRWEPVLCFAQGPRSLPRPEAGRRSVQV
jgi:hypothetical protein